MIHVVCEVRSCLGTRQVAFFKKSSQSHAAGAIYFSRIKGRAERVQQMPRRFRSKKSIFAGRTYDDIDYSIRYFACAQRLNIDLDTPMLLSQLVDSSAKWELAAQQLVG